MSNIATSGSFIPNATNTPLDARTRIAALANIPDIEVPYIGMHFYVTGTGVEYIVKTLKSKTVGALETADAQIDTYEAVPDAGDIEAVVEAVAGKADTADLETLSGVVAGKASAEDLEALAATVATKVEDFSFTVAVDAETNAVSASYTPAGGSATPLTVSEDGQTITIPLATLGISGLYTYDLYSSDGRLMSNTAELAYQITSENLVLKFAGGWTAGDWKLKGGTGGASGAKGDPGAKGDTGAQGTLTEAFSYNAETAYAYLALVIYGGSTYQCIASAGSTAGDLPTDPSKFKLIAKNGYGSTVWSTLAYSASLSLSASNGENQKATLTGNVAITSPTLDADNPTLLLQITAGGYDIEVDSVLLVEAGSGTYQVGWYFDGTTTRRYGLTEVV